MHTWAAWDQTKLLGGTASPPACKACNLKMVAEEHFLCLLHMSQYFVVPHSHMSLGASQSSPLFSSQGTDQGFGHFKGCLNRKILPVDWNVCSLKIPQCTAKTRKHRRSLYAPLPEITSHFWSMKHKPHEPTRLILWHTIEDLKRQTVFFFNISCIFLHKHTSLDR